MFNYNDSSPNMPTFLGTQPDAPNLGSGVSGGDPRMNQLLAAKKKSPVQSFLDFAQQGQNMMGGGQQQQQQNRPGILGGIKEIGNFFL